jgi:hypothetical protein
MFNAQRHTIASSVKQFTENKTDLQSRRWFNQDRSGQYLTVELSPRYVARERERPINMFDMFQEKEEFIDSKI